MLQNFIKLPSIAALPHEQRSQVIATHKRLVFRSWPLWVGWGMVGLLAIGCFIASLVRWCHPPTSNPAFPGPPQGWGDVLLTGAFGVPILYAAFVMLPTTHRLYRRALTMNGVLDK